MGARITLFTRPGCILCGQVRDLLVREDIPFEEIVVTDHVSELVARAGARWYPALFVDDRYIGGFTHLVHLLTEGRLHSLAKGAK